MMAAMQKFDRESVACWLDQDSNGSTKSQNQPDLCQAGQPESESAAEGSGAKVTQPQASGVKEGPVADIRGSTDVASSQQENASQEANSSAEVSSFLKANAGPPSTVPHCKNVCAMPQGFAQGMCTAC